jgi:site-specific recombinase XerD
LSCINNPDIGINSEVMQEYITELELMNRNPITIHNKLYRLHKFFAFTEKQVGDVIKTDIERYSLNLKKEGLKKTTQDKSTTDLKSFLTG